MTTKLFFIGAFAAFAAFSAVLLSSRNDDFLIDGPAYPHAAAAPVVVPQS